MGIRSDNLFERGLAGEIVDVSTSVERSRLLASVEGVKVRDFPVILKGIYVKLGVSARDIRHFELSCMEALLSFVHDIRYKRLHALALNDDEVSKKCFKELAWSIYRCGRWNDATPFDKAFRVTIDLAAGHNYSGFAGRGKAFADYYRDCWMKVMPVTAGEEQLQEELLSLYLVQGMARELRPLIKE
jgi:hypothetical protein